MAQLDEDYKKKIAQYNNLREKYQFIYNSISQVESNIREVKASLVEIEKLGKDAILYRSLSGIFSKITSDEAIAFLKKQEEELAKVLAQFKEQDVSVGGELNSLKEELKAKLSI